MADPILHRDETLGFLHVDLDAVRRSRNWFIGLGIAFVVLGVLAILMPFAASLGSTLFLGWLMLIGGIIQCVHAVQHRSWAHWGWAFAAGVVGVIAGLLVVAYPVAGTLTLTLVFAAYFIAEGIFKTIRAIQHRDMPSWGWLLFDGILSLVLGAIIVSGWPGSAVWAVGLLVGINLLFGGTSMLMIGLGAGRVAHARP